MLIAIMYKNNPAQQRMLQISNIISHSYKNMFHSLSILELKLTIAKQQPSANIVWMQL